MPNSGKWLEATNRNFLPLNILQDWAKRIQPANLFPKYMLTKLRATGELYCLSSMYFSWRRGVGDSHCGVGGPTVGWGSPLWGSWCKDLPAEDSNLTTLWSGRLWIMKLCHHTCSMLRTMPGICVPGYNMSWLTTCLPPLYWRSLASWLCNDVASQHLSKAKCCQTSILLHHDQNAAFDMQAFKPYIVNSSTEALWSWLLIPGSLFNIEE